MLNVVATPIGNLRDITFRAIDVLREVDLIACEDTRRTGVLLKAHEIDTPKIAYHDHNKTRMTTQLIERMKNGETVALVSDAGTPSISDPGFYLVRECHREGIPVSPIPGPSAPIAALSASGMPTDRFMFVGFVPKKPGRRKALFQELTGREGTVVCYESPHRIRKTLGVIAEVLPDWQVCTAREITKRFEEFKHGKATELAATASTKGEYVILLHTSYS